MGAFTENNLVFRRPQQPNQPNVGGPGQIPGSGHITNVNGQPPNQINPNAPVFHPTGDEYSPRPHVNPSSTFNPAFQAQQQSQVRNDDIQFSEIFIAYLIDKILKLFS